MVASAARARRPQRYEASGPSSSAMRSLRPEIMEAHEITGPMPITSVPKTPEHVRGVTGPRGGHRHDRAPRRSD